MDYNDLFISMFLGLAGMGFLGYGKTTGQYVPIAVGVALMICPYFITNLMALSIVCLVLAAVPFVVREA